MIADYFFCDNLQGARLQSYIGIIVTVVSIIIVQAIRMRFFENKTRKEQLIINVFNVLSLSLIPVIFMCFDILLFLKKITFLQGLFGMLVAMMIDLYVVWRFGKKYNV